MRKLTEVEQVRRDRLARQRTAKFRKLVERLDLALEQGEESVREIEEFMMQHLEAIRRAN